MNKSMMEELRASRWDLYRRQPLFWRVLCSLAWHDPDYSMFIAGILSGFPATFLLNLVTMQFSEIRRPALYMSLYAVCMVCSAVFCWAGFRLSVLHAEVHHKAQKMAEKGFGTREEKRNELVVAFAALYPAKIRKNAIFFFGSAIVTFFSILAICLAQIL